MRPRRILALLVSLILALLLLRYGPFLVGALWMLFGKPNSYAVVFHVKFQLVWVLSSTIFGSAFLFELRRASSKAKRQKI
jgi:hypothetical protein